MVLFCLSIKPFINFSFVCLDKKWSTMLTDEQSWNSCQSILDQIGHLWKRQSVSCFDRGFAGMSSKNMVQNMIKIDSIQIQNMVEYFFHIYFVKRKNLWHRVDSDFVFSYQGDIKSQRIDFLYFDF